jgi:hypothetical protein
MGESVGGTLTLDLDFAFPTFRAAAILDFMRIGLKA